jgi:putative membrane protein
MSLVKHASSIVDHCKTTEEIPMRTHLYSVLFAAATFASGAIAQLPQTEEMPSGALAGADVDFLQTADAANMDQLMLGKRAASRARNSGVHSLADNVVRSYTKADDALRLLAAAKHVDLAHRPSEKGQDDADALLDRKGALDREYVVGVTNDTDDLIAMYEDARDHSDDPDIRRYADTMLPALHDHQRQASDILARESDNP